MVGRLATLEQRMEAVDLAASTAGELESLLSAINQAQRTMDVYLTRVATELRARERAGDSPTADDVLRSGGEVSRREAERRAQRAEVVALLPLTGAAALSGEVRPENLDTIGRALDTLNAAHRAQLVALDAEIAERAVRLRPETFERYLRREVHRIRDIQRKASDGDGDDDLSEAEKEKARSRFNMGRRRDGRWFLRGDLDDERASLINEVLNQHARELAGDNDPTASTRATALYNLIAGVPDPQPSPGAPTPASPAYRHSRSGLGGYHRLAIGYIVDARTLAGDSHTATVAQTWEGEDVDPRAAQRLACDADLYAILLDRCGTPTGVGRTRRSATRAQRLALRALYQSCPLDGTPFGWCEIHHVNVSFDAGGETEIHNLVPVSPRWHHRIHDQGWTLRMATDRTLTLWRPNGTLDRTVAPPTPLTRHGPEPPDRAGSDQTNGSGL